MARNEKDDNKKPENSEGIQITPPDENKKADAEMCILCENKPAYKTATVDSDLCEECREGFIRTPIRFSGIIAFVLIIAMVLSGFMLIHPQKSTISAIYNGYKNIHAGNYDTAINGISDAVVQGTVGWKTAGTFAKLCKKINLPNDMVFLVEEFFYDKTANNNLKWQDTVGKGDINASWNKDVKASYDYLKLVEKIASEKSVYFTDYYNLLNTGEMEPKDIPYDEIINKYKAELAKATTNEEKGVIYYYMLATSSVCEKDIKTQLAYCKEIVKYIPDCYWLYLDNLITLSIQAGEYAQAQKHIDTLSKFSANDANYAKRYTAMLYRHQGKYDEALVILKDLIANISTTNIYEAYFEAALCEFLKGNLKEAYEYTIQCVEYEYHLSYESINLHALLSKHLGDEEAYAFASDIFEQYGLKISPSVDKYIKGEITAKDLFKNGEVTFE